MLTKINVFDLSEIIDYIMFNYNATRDQAMDFIDLILFAKYESLRSKNIVWVHDPDSNFLGTDTILVEYIKSEPVVYEMSDFKSTLKMVLDIDHIINDGHLGKFWNSVDDTDSSLDIFERKWINASDLMLEVV